MTYSNSNRWTGFRVGDYFCFKEATPPKGIKKVGLISASALIIGAMIGGGVFICPGTILQMTGSPILSLLVWYFSGLLSLCAALSYVELHSIFPHSSGEHSYFMAIYGPYHQYLGPLPAFLFQWSSIFLIRPINVAINALSASKYIEQMAVSTEKSSELSVKCIAFIILIFLVLLNSNQGESSVATQTGFTIVKFCVLLTVIIGGLLNATNMFWQHDEPNDGNYNFFPVASAFYNGLIAYNGWNSLVYCTDMLEKPMTTLPIAAIISMSTVTLLYLLMNVSYFLVLPLDTIVSSSTLIISWAKVVAPALVFAVPLGVVLTILSSANASTLVSTRLYMSAATDGHLPTILGMSGRSNKAPIPALLLFSSITFFYILLNDIQILIDLFSFTAWIYYGLSFLALLWFRWQLPDHKHGFNNPIIIPIFALLASIFLIILPIRSNPNIPIVCIIINFIGVVFYTVFVYGNIKLSCFAKFCSIIQNLLDLAPHSPIKTDRNIRMITLLQRKDD